MVKAVAFVRTSGGITGTIFFTQETAGPTTVAGNISGLKPGLHSIYLYPLGETLNGSLSTRLHGKGHGALDDVTVGDDGNATFTIIDNHIQLTEPNSVIGSIVVIYAHPDVLAKGGHELSKSVGNEGRLVACGVICVPPV